MHGNIILKLNNYSLKEIYKSKMFLSSTRFEKNMSLDMTDDLLSKQFNKIKLKENIIKKQINLLKKNLIKIIKFLVFILEINL